MYVRHHEQFEIGAMLNKNILLLLQLLPPGDLNAASMYRGEQLL